MLPQAGLVIPLYVVLAKYHLTNALHGARRHAPASSCSRSRSGRCAGSSSGSRRSSRRRRWSTARAVWARSRGSCSRSSRPGSSRRPCSSFITSWNEYIFANVILTDQANQTLTVWLSYFYGTSRATDWGGLMAASTLTAIPVVIFFLARPAEDRVRPDRGRGQGMMGRARAPRARAASSRASRGRAARLDPPSARRRARRRRALRLERREPRAARGAHRTICAPSDATSSSRSTRRAATSRGSRPATGSSYPGNAALGVVDDVELTERVAAAMGARARGRRRRPRLRAGRGRQHEPPEPGHRHPLVRLRRRRSSRDMSRRSFAGCRRAGVAACAKHFPGHGDTSADSHLELPRPVDLDSIVADALPPFRAAIEAGVRSIMTAHIVVRALGDVPATMSRAILARPPARRARLRRPGDDRCARDAGDQRHRRSRGGRGARARGRRRRSLPRPRSRSTSRSLEHARRRSSRPCARDGFRRSDSPRRRPCRRARGAGRRSIRRERSQSIATSGGSRRGALCASKGDVALARPPLVVELEPAPGMAAGPLPQLPGEWLRRRVPDRRGRARCAKATSTRRPSSTAASSSSSRATRIATRGSATPSSALTARARRRDRPRGRPPALAAGAGRDYIATYGAARVNVEAALQPRRLYSGPRRGVEQSGSSPGS